MEDWKSFEWSEEMDEYEDFKPNLTCIRMLQPLQFNQYDPDPWGENAHTIERPFHYQRRESSLRTAVWYIKKHDRFQMNGRKW